MPQITGGPIPCPDPFYELMLKCWNRSPENRPTFDYLREFFNNYAVFTDRGYEYVE
ncbi:hypothetical protein DPMN_057061 [Dreissena polymorpha]|uniref:Serine-threonine/tyrosine-protein kinase catalytic domain-containing protein n=1 Tax=Dreissena polymorpha TaxID=45954 RepID=A0A9D4CUF7_DREPO|nr:hypothetical protein DPMN_057061 [Dreissena polymorpha]